MKKRALRILIIITILLLGFISFQMFTGFMVYNANNVSIPETFIQDIDTDNANFYDTNNNGMIDKIEFKKPAKIANIKIKSRDKERVIIRFKDNNLVVRELTKEQINKLLKEENIDKISPDLKFDLTLQDTIPLINADDMHNTQIRNNITGITEAACILDTGIYSEHPDFSGRILAEQCYADDDVIGNNLGYCFNNTEEYADANDDIGHGTLVAGIVSASGGIKGIAPGVNLVVVKICNKYGQCYYSDLIKGMNYCINNKEKYNISVITLSLGTGYVYSDAASCNLDNIEVTDAINNAFANGIFIDSSAGNSGSSLGISNPACLANVTSVGATTKSDVIATYSNRGDLLDLLAPGSNINTTSCIAGGSLCNPSSYTDRYSGTSFASPHVAGAVVLLKQYAKEKFDTNLEPDEIRNALKTSGKSISYNNKTYPRIDVLSAVDYLNNYFNESLDIWSDLNKQKPYYYFKEYLENITFYANYTKRGRSINTSCKLYFENKSYDMAFDGINKYIKKIEDFRDYDYNISCGGINNSGRILKEDFDFYKNHTIMFAIKNFENESLFDLNLLVYEFNNSLLYNQSIGDGDLVNMTEFLIINSEFVNKTPHRIILNYENETSEMDLELNQSIDLNFVLNMSQNNMTAENESITPSIPATSSGGGGSGKKEERKAEEPRQFELFEVPKEQDTRILEKKEPLKEYQSIIIYGDKTIIKPELGLISVFGVILIVLLAVVIQIKKKRFKKKRIH